MKRLLPIISLFCAAQTFAQVPLDSAYWDTEIDDSIRSFAIKPVEHPEELLMQALVRLEKDMQCKHSKREYHLAAILNNWSDHTLTLVSPDIKTTETTTNTMPPLTCRRTFTVEGDNGFDIMNPKYAVKSPLSVEMPYYVPVTLEDRSFIEFKLSSPFSYENTLHVEVNRSQYKFMEIYHLFTYYTLEKIYKSILEVYDVTAYYIGDDSGKGVYRIHLDEKKRQRTREAQESYQNQEMKWYLDSQSLRLTQINAKRLFNGYVTIYRNDFGEENGAPVLTKATKLTCKGNRLIQRTAIQCSPSNLQDRQIPSKPSRVIYIQDGKKVLLK